MVCRARRLAGFVHTLRDNGFRVGLAETRRWARNPCGTAGRAGIHGEACVSRAVLRDTFGLGAFRRDLRRLLAGSWCSPGAHSCRLRPRKGARSRGNSRMSGHVDGTPGLPDHVERRHDDGDGTGDGTRQARGRLADRKPRSTDLRHIVDAADIARAHALAARLSRVMRARLVRRERVRSARASPRSAPDHSPKCFARRHSAGSRLAPAQDQAAASGISARCIRLDEPLHRVLRPLPARRRRCVPRVGGFRFPYQAGACVRLAARPRRHACGRQAGADGAGHRRRHAKSARASPRSTAGTRGA